MQTRQDGLWGDTTLPAASGARPQPYADEHIHEHTDGNSHEHSDQHQHADGDAYHYANSDPNTDPNGHRRPNADPYRCIHQRADRCALPNCNGRTSACLRAARRLHPERGRR